MSHLEDCTNIVSTAEMLTLIINIITKRKGPAQDKLKSFCSTTCRNAKPHQQTRLMTPAEPAVEADHSGAPSQLGCVLNLCPLSGAACVLQRLVWPGTDPGRLQQAPSPLNTGRFCYLRARSSHQPSPSHIPRAAARADEHLHPHCHAWQRPEAVVQGTWWGQDIGWRGDSYAKPGPGLRPLSPGSPNRPYC